MVHARSPGPLGGSAGGAEPLGGSAGGSEPLGGSAGGSDVIVDRPDPKVLTPSARPITDIREEEGEGEGERSLGSVAPSTPLRPQSTESRAEV